MKNRKRLSGICGAIAAVVMTAGLAGVGSAPAIAAPSNCDWGVGSRDDQGWAVCFNGTGEYRAKIKCDATWPTSNYYKWGSWVRVGGGVRSYAACSHNDSVMETGVEKR